MKLQFGIREKMLAPLVLGLTVIICILFFYWQPGQLSKAKSEFIESQTNLLKTLNPSIIQNILANDLAELHSVFEHSQVIHADTWKYIELKDPDNKRLYPVFSEKQEQKETLLKINHTIEENDEIFGYITLHTDWKKTKEKELKNINQLSLLSTLLLIGIGAFSFILQTKWVYTPITKLKNITYQLSKDNYTTQLPKLGSDEIGSLTKSIEHLRNKIQTTLAALTNKEKEQAAILATAPNAIITTDKYGTIKSFNPSAEKTFHYSVDEIIGKNLSILMPDDIATMHDHYLHSFKGLSQTKIIGDRQEIYGKTKEGDTFPIEVSLNSNIINDEYLFTGVIRDITEQRKVEYLKNEFVATVSHELRTPLTAIKGSLDLVTQGMAVELPEQAETMLDIAKRNVERLLILINDILDVSKLESGEINFLLETMDIKPFIKDSIELNQEYAKKYNTTFMCTHCDSSAMIHVDKDRLKQVMSNLLSNAAKYSPENIPVEISTNIINNILRVSVKDYGQGIPEEFQSSVFGKFTQSSSGDTRQVGGTGLGLSITKMIIEKLGGKIGFDTIVAKETTFYFELPIVKIK